MLLTALWLINPPAWHVAEWDRAGAEVGGSRAQLAMLWIGLDPHLWRALLFQSTAYGPKCNT